MFMGITFRGTEPKGQVCSPSMSSASGLCKVGIVVVLFVGDNVDGAVEEAEAETSSALFQVLLGEKKMVLALCEGLKSALKD